MRLGGRTDDGEEAAAIRAVDEVAISSLWAVGCTAGQHAASLCCIRAYACMRKGRGCKVIIAHNCCSL